MWFYVAMAGLLGFALDVACMYWLGKKMFKFLNTGRK